jgi:hypothetical protein
MAHYSASDLPRLAAAAGARRVIVTGEDDMKTLCVASFLLIFTMPAWGKIRQVYPVPCDDLWTAVKDTLGNQSNYGIVYMDEYRQKASFTVVGALIMYTHRLQLTANGSGCTLNANILQEGADDTDWRQFRKRLGKSLAKMQAAKPKPPVPPSQ